MIQAKEMGVSCVFVKTFQLLYLFSVSFIIYVVHFAAKRKLLVFAKTRQLRVKMYASIKKKIQLNKAKSITNMELV